MSADQCPGLGVGNESFANRKAGIEAQRGKWAGLSTTLSGSADKGSGHRARAGEGPKQRQRTQPASALVFSDTSSSS